MFKPHARALPPIAVAILVVGLAVGETCIPVAHAAPQEPQTGQERMGLQLDVVVTQSAAESGSPEPTQSRSWRFSARTTSGQRVTVQNAHAELEATPHRVEDGWVAVAFDLTVFSHEEPEEIPRRPGPLNTLVIEVSAEEVVLEQGAPTVVAAFTDETSRTVEVTFTATRRPLVVRAAAGGTSAR